MCGAINGDSVHLSALISLAEVTGISSWLMVQTVEGIVVDVGWYRTTIRSFEREIFNIPNSVFSRNVVLNVTRKGKEWRFYEFIGEWLCTGQLDFHPVC